MIRTIQLLIEKKTTKTISVRRRQHNNLFRNIMFSFYQIKNEIKIDDSSALHENCFDVQ